MGFWFFGKKDESKYKELVVILESLSKNVSDIYSLMQKPKEIKIGRYYYKDLSKKEYDFIVDIVPGEFWVVARKIKDLESDKNVKDIEMIDIKQRFKLSLNSFNTLLNKNKGVAVGERYAVGDPIKGIQINLRKSGEIEISRRK